MSKHKMKIIALIMTALTIFASAFIEECASQSADIIIETIKTTLIDSKSGK
jgi:uncharacterized membrane protein